MAVDERTFEKGEEIRGINVTPLVDVSLVLVLIFMVTSPFFAKALMDVKLPEAVASEAEDRKNISVSLSPDGEVDVNEIRVTEDTLEQELKRQLDNSGFSFVLIRADERVPHGDIQKVIKVAKKLGVAKISFATSPKMG